jgi:TonB-linked SusC/RagA family outer membrane protein
MQTKNIKRSYRGIFSLLALLMTLTVSAQQLKVKGVVVDENKIPLIGATIMVNGSSKGTVTDFDGKFALKVKRGRIITISYVGYQSQDVKIRNKKPLKIQLKPDAQMLDDVVVVGYSQVKRSDLTGSVASVSSKNIEGYKSGSVMEALGGQISGVLITQTDGTPGSGFDVKIRGIGTVTGDSSPLYIVDGFQVDNIDYLSNSDIESIEVLKDASSSAIYGARAANGVVLVTTKSGKNGAPRISYSGSMSYRNVAKSLEVLNPYEFAKLQVEIAPDKYGSTYYKSGDDEEGNPYRYQSLEDYKNVKGIDWQDEVLRPTWSSNHSLSINGGNKQTKYAFSFSHFDEDGVFKNSGFKKTTGKMRIKQKITKKIDLDANITYANTTKLGNGTSSGSGRFNILAQVLGARPTGGLLLTDEELLHTAIDPLEMQESSSLAQVNPVNQAESVHKKKNSELWAANASLSIKLMKNLMFKTAATYRTTNTRSDIFYNDGSKEAYRNGDKPYGQTQMIKSVRWTNFNYLTYNKKFKKHHKIDVMIGQEASYSSNEYLMGQAKDFPFDNLGNDNLGLGATPSKVLTDFRDQMLLSFFTRVNYNYKDRYLFTATVRADGSTVFSSKNKWGYFPSFSAAWRVSQESFMQDIESISNLKLRLGWGTVGNDRISNCLSLDIYDQSKYGLGSNLVTVLTPEHLKNKNLKWEGSTTLNIGLDLGLFGNRINFSADYFVKNTKDLLLAQSLSYVTGFPSQMQNIGKIQNSGLELSLNTVNLQSNDLVWRTDFNISFLTNKLKALQSGVHQMYARSGFNGQFTDYDYIAKVGSSLGLIYGYEFDGVYQSSDFNLTPSGELQLKPGVTRNMRYNDGDVAPGVVKYKDQNGDGIANTEDRTVIGNTLPKFFGGINNTFNYKDFDFSFMFQFSFGNDIYNATRLNATQTREERKNMLAEVTDRWTPTHASNKVPSAEGYVNYEVYSRFIEDGSFLRLKNVVLGYTVPKKLTRKFLISNLRIYASAQNLFCLTNYSGYDPEVSMSRNPMTPGLDWGAYPKSRIFTFGIDLKF